MPLTHAEVVETYRKTKERFKFLQRIYSIAVVVVSLVSALVYYKTRMDEAAYVWLGLFATLALVFTIAQYAILRCPVCKKSLSRKVSGEDVGGEDGYEFDPNRLACHHCSARLQ